MSSAEDIILKLPAKPVQKMLEELYMMRRHEDGKFEVIDMGTSIRAATCMQMMA